MHAWLYSVVSLAVLLQFPEEADQAITYTYDHRGRVFKMEVANNGYGRTHYGWDALNRLAYVTNVPFGTHAGWTGYSYDRVGNLKTVQSSKHSESRIQPANYLHL